MLSVNTPEGVFLQLVAAMLRGEKPQELPDNIGFEEIYEIGSRQEMTAITFCALDMLQNKIADEKRGEWQKRFLDAAIRNEIQLAEYNALVSRLCESGVKLIPLKGSVIKQLYPSPVFRAMGDLDFLYDGATIEKLAELMQEQGYSAENLEKGYHDAFRKKPCMNVELHRELVQPGSPYCACFDGIWERVVPDKAVKNLYNMKPEDLYIHVIVHAAKHFLHSGIGVRPICDVYVLRKAYAGEWDSAYIDAAFSKVGLTKFADKVAKIAMCWFGGETLSCDSGISQEDELFFFRGSTFGRHDEIQKWMYSTSNSKNKSAYLLKRVFLPYKSMRVSYPVLMKCPVLLPIMWIVRWFDVLFKRPNNIDKSLKAVKGSSEETDYFKRIMSDFGLKQV